MKARKKGLPRSTAKIKKVNLRAAKKRHARYAAYIASPEWRAKREECLRLAGYRCSRKVNGVRCPNTTRLTANHLSYARFTRELQSDLECACHDCHMAYEALKPGKPLWLRARTA